MANIRGDFGSPVEALEEDQLRVKGMSSQNNYHSFQGGKGTFGEKKALEKYWT